VVGRVAVKRLCGCEGEFEQLSGDRFAQQRLDKFKNSRCPVCAAKRAEEQQRLLVPKAEAYAALPPETQVALVSAPDGSWSARLTASGRTVEASGHGPEAALLAVARLWLVGS
jgi:hypothetical protein